MGKNAKMFAVYLEKKNPIIIIEQVRIPSKFL